jgi:hypothetical protein
LRWRHLRRQRGRRQHTSKSPMPKCFKVHRFILPSYAAKALF